MWTLKGDVTPPLVVGNRNSDVLYGGTGIGDQVSSGMRITAGMWFGDNHYWGLDFSGFFLGDKTDHFSAGGNALGLPRVGRPFIYTGPTIPGAGGLPPINQGDLVREFVSEPGVIAGRVDIERSSRLWGFDANLRRGILCSESGFLDFFFGYRQAGLDESLSITEDLVTLADMGTLNGMTIPRSSTILVRDTFTTSNRFYGGQVGLACEYRVRNLSFGFKGKVALGNTQQMANIVGSTASNGVTLPGGLLALPTNSGHYYRNSFSVLPEATFTLGYQVTPWWRLTVGYNFLYWSSVIRPGGLVDQAVNPSFQPGAVPMNMGAPRPAPQFLTSDFWAQGVTFGCEFRW